MDRRQHNDYAKEASFHGVSIPFRANRDAEIKREEQDGPAIDPEFHDKAMRAAQERVKARFRNG